ELAMLRPEWIVEHATEPTPAYTPPSRADGPRMMGVARRHAEIHALLKQGLNRASIARRLNLRWATVNKYVLAPSAEPLIRSCRFRTKLDPFLPFLAQRWSEGEHVAATLANAHRLAQQFLRLVRDRPGGRKLDQWAVAVRKTGPPELRGFSRNLQRDWHAVSAGVTERWSSGPVEGHINKLKMIKRQMFGR